ncbi:tethering complex subunit, partial [Linderina pennispora]
MSLLDDYAEYELGADHHQQLAHSDFDSDDVVADPLATDGYVTTTLEDAPIFSLDRVQFQVPNQVIAMAVANDMLVLVIEGARIMRIDLQEAHNIREFEIPVKPTDLKACTAFLDPTGRHLLISTPQGENFYHYEDWEAAKPLSRFKNMEVTAVAWNHMATTNGDSTKRILLGTHDGRIYESELRPGSDAKAKRSEIPLKLAGNVPVRERITGIAMVSFPKRTKQNLVLVSTGTRLYQLVGAADTAASSDKLCAFEGLFTEGFANPNFQEIPGMPGPGSLAVYHNGTTATDFAWLTSMGVFFGKLVFGSQESGDSVIENASLLPYPASAGNEQPLSLELTEFHILLQYSNQIRALNMLNCKPAYDQP